MKQVSLLKVYTSKFVADPGSLPSGPKLTVQCLVQSCSVHMSDVQYFDVRCDTYMYVVMVMATA